LNNPFYFFDVIYCINLDSDTDRWDHISHVFNKLGISERVTRIPGVIDTSSTDSKTNAINGCTESHLLCIKNTINNDYNNCFIFEDDADLFFDEVTTNKNIFYSICSIPNQQWGMLFFGANVHYSKVQKISPSLSKAEYCYNAHAYAISKNTLQYIFKNLDKAKNKSIDVFYVEDIMENIDCYISIPLLFGSKPGFSHLREEYVNYNPMFLNTYEAALRKVEIPIQRKKHIAVRRSKNPAYVAW